MQCPRYASIRSVCRRPQLSAWGGRQTCPQPISWSAPATSPPSVRLSESLAGGTRRNPSDVVRVIFGKPEIAIRAAGDPVGIAAAGNTATGGGEGELLNGASGRNPSDGIPVLFGKPEIAIRTAGDPLRPACMVDVTGGGEGELGDGASGPNPSDSVPCLFGEPEIAIRTAG